MRRDCTLGTIINNEFGTCKYLYKHQLEDMVEVLKGYTYVKEKNFTDEELKWHIETIVDALFHPYRFVNEARV